MLSQSFPLNRDKCHKSLRQKGKEEEIPIVFLCIFARVINWYAEHWHFFCEYRHTISDLSKVLSDKSATNDRILLLFGKFVLGRALSKVYLQGMTVQKRIVLQRRITWKIRCRKDKWIRCLSVSLPFRLLHTIYFHIIGVCKHFYAAQSWHMLFRLLKDAWLTCNKCPFSVLPTPFWSPIKHLL